MLSSTAGTARGTNHIVHANNARPTSQRTIELSQAMTPVEADRGIRFNTAPSPAGLYEPIAR